MNQVIQIAKFFTVLITGITGLLSPGDLGIFDTVQTVLRVSNSLLQSTFNQWAMRFNTHQHHTSREARKSTAQRSYLHFPHCYLLCLPPAPTALDAIELQWRPAVAMALTATPFHPNRFNPTAYVSLSSGLTVPA
ncbi:hypothetical protein [Shewanella sp. FJAT-52076]|uniref:hypothetical protein n=1 Tax=Shewanella sp. FJAT-52076 TaxID=2864202 RepID=UPI001C65B2DE|nr:hypothetical protein [Shewanella sp. FJAT-52076]QYJ76691.1 hypothetical protein K0H79_06910 [Shewanella sp. FJAT-52076]